MLSGIKGTIGPLKMRECARVNAKTLTTISRVIKKRSIRLVWLCQQAMSVIAVNLTAIQDLHAGHARAELADPQVTDR